MLDLGSPMEKFRCELSFESDEMDCMCTVCRDLEYVNTPYLLLRASHLPRVERSPQVWG